MGRKIDMRKIEDITRCQVTFSKRRSSVMKKANEVAVCCDVDIAFVAFSPSGRVSKYCNKKRIEDVLDHYVDLPADKRLSHINDVQEKMEKLRQLGHIKGDTSKLQYLDKQIEILELQIKKSSLELQILESGLRDYEFGPEEEPSLHQLSWCERNLNHSLQKIITKKNEFVEKFKKTDFKPSQMDFDGQRGILSSNFNENVENLTLDGHFTGDILMELDPWISPYSARVRESILQDILDEANCTRNEHVASNIPNFSNPANIGNYPILDSANICEPEITVLPNALISSTHLPVEMIFSNPIHMSSQSSCNIQGPRFTSTTIVTSNPTREEITQPLSVEMGDKLQLSSLNSSELSNMNGQEQIGQLNMEYFSSWFNNIRSKTRIDNHEGCSESGDNMISSSKEYKSGSWEWENLLLEEHLNLQDFS